MDMQQQVHTPPEEEVEAPPEEEVEAPPEEEVEAPIEEEVEEVEAPAQFVEPDWGEPGPIFALWTDEIDEHGALSPLQTMPHDAYFNLMERIRDKGSITSHVADAYFIWFEMATVAQAQRIVAKLDGQRIRGGKYLVHAKQTNKDVMPASGDTTRELGALARKSEWHLNRRAASAEEANWRGGGGRHQARGRGGGGSGGYNPYWARGGGGHNPEIVVVVVVAITHIELVVAVAVVVVVAEGAWQMCPLTHLW